MKLYNLLEKIVNEIILIKSRTRISNLMRNTSNVPEDSSYTCYYYPGLGICFACIYIAPRSSRVYAEGEAYNLYTVPAQYRPSRIHAGSVQIGGTHIANVRITADGEIILAAKTNISTGWDVYVTLWWKSASS